MQSLFEKLGLADENPGVFYGDWRGSGAVIEKFSPIDGKLLARVRTRDRCRIRETVSARPGGFRKWRVTPGPVRGETVRQLGNALARTQITSSASSSRSRSGKIVAEGEGEVQEMIDICDFAVGQSRMLYGLTIQSERPNHRLMEQWHPLGLVAIISCL